MINITAGRSLLLIPSLAPSGASAALEGTPRPACSCKKRLLSLLILRRRFLAKLLFATPLAPVSLAGEAASPTRRRHTTFDKEISEEKLSIMRHARLAE
jgi:hypothetical protein